MVMLQLRGGNDASIEGREVPQGERDVETTIQEQQEESEEEILEEMNQDIANNVR